MGGDWRRAPSIMTIKTMTILNCANGSYSIRGKRRKAVLERKPFEDTIAEERTASEMTITSNINNNLAWHFGIIAAFGARGALIQRKKSSEEKDGGKRKRTIRPDAHLLLIRRHGDIYGKGL